MDLTDREKQFMLERDQLAAEKQRILDEKLRSEDEFGKIRAKFKDLYLQREAQIVEISEEKRKIESEINDVRAAAMLSQTTAQEEIDQLNRRHGEEVRQYRQQLLEARSHVNMMRNENEETEPENLEESMFKAKKDAEMLKEIIVPLETELKELKLQCQQLMSENMKLRAAQTADNKPQPTVDMLLNLDDDYGAAELAVEANSREQLEQTEQELATEKHNVGKLTEGNAVLSEQVRDYQVQVEQLERQVLELQEETQLKWTEQEELKRSVQGTETKWNEMTTGFTQKIDNVGESFDLLRESHNSARNELGNFTSDVKMELEEFENFKKKLTEDFEKLKMKLNDERRTHEDAQALLTDSLESCRKEILRLENVQTELDTSKELNDKLQNDVISVTDKLNESQRKSKDVILGLQKQILAVNSEKEEAISRIARLGKELSESLSVRDELAIQSSELQVQLESQRELLKNIKWEHEDDVTNCRGCDVPFSMTRRKSHCRKCGRIFCGECCGNTIEFGENRRQYKACGDCVIRHSAEQPAEYHTLTVPN